MSRNLRKERYSVLDLKVHLVCVTKYRQKIFTAESLKLIEKSFSAVGGAPLEVLKSHIKKQEKPS